LFEEGGYAVVAVGCASAVVDAGVLYDVLPEGYGAEDAEDYRNGYSCDYAFSTLFLGVFHCGFTFPFIFFIKLWCILRRG
jgi:hypothetical protein